MSILFWRKNGLLMRQYLNRTSNRRILITSDTELCKNKNGGVIAQQITNKEGNDGGIPVWDLRPYKFINLEIQPYQRWVLRDVGQAHWNDPYGKACSGSTYGNGSIDQKTGELIGLPDEFKTSYSYNGYMQLLGGVLDCTTNKVNFPCK